MPKYITTHGEPTTATNPEREIWYSIHCTYWTDDWSKLKTVGPGIPVCPKCGCPGMQTMALHWDKGVKQVDDIEPGYASFLSGCKEKCYGKNVTIKRLWECVKASGNSEMDKALNDAIKELTDAHNSKTNNT